MTCEWHEWVDSDDDAQEGGIPFVCQLCGAPGYECARCEGNGCDDDENECQQCNGEGVVAD